MTIREGTAMGHKLSITGRTSSLAPFYARAWRRRLRWPLLISAVVILLMVAGLIVSGYLI